MGEYSDQKVNLIYKHFRLESIVYESYTFKNNVLAIPQEQYWCSRPRIIHFRLITLQLRSASLSFLSLLTGKRTAKIKQEVSPKRYPQTI